MQVVGALLVAVVTAGAAPPNLKGDRVPGRFTGARAPAVAYPKALDGSVTLTFEGLADQEAVASYYAGGKGSAGSGPGPNYGVTFSANALACIDFTAGGSCTYVGEPSAPTHMNFVSGSAATMNVNSGFTTGFSFYYAANQAGQVIVYDGANASGNVLATLSLPASPPTEAGTPSWAPFGVTFSGTAHSVDFGGAENYIAFDNITLGIETPHPRQVSSTVHGNPTTKDSTHVTLTSDGQSALFQSQENDLVASNSNVGGQDIYRVGADGVAVLESVNNVGQQLIGTSSSATVSTRGDVVAFTFAPVAAAQSAKAGIFQSIYAGGRGNPKHQVDTGMGGVPADGSVSGSPSLDGAGDKVVFCSSASNLVGGDTNGKTDVFLANPFVPHQATQRVSTDSHGAQLSGDSCEPRISLDGTKVVFTTSAPELYGNAIRQVVRKDLVSGALELLSPSTAGGGLGGNGTSSEPVIDSDGKTVAFTSRASDLDALGAPTGSREAFVSIAHKNAAGAARLLKRLRPGDGTIPNGFTAHPQLSADGSIAVLQTSATNFFGPGKSFFTSGCGAVALSTNFYTPALLGSSLCDGKTTNASPTISGDGGTTGYDSNAAQPGTSSSNSNAYSQPLGTTSANGAAAMSGDFSGQWFNPNESGHGLVIDVYQPDASNARIVNMTWFVFDNGKPTWVQGAGVAKAGTGTKSGSVVVQIDSVGIFKSSAFPAGPTVTPTLWGSMTLTFADANSGTMEWTSTYPGFNNFYEPLTRFLPARLPAQDPADAQIKACYSGNWFNSSLSGQGFEFEAVTLAGPPAQQLLAVDWFAFDSSGAPVWLQGVGPISGNTAQVELALYGGSGAQFPPSFNSAGIHATDWGSIVVTFADSSHATVSWTPKLAGYGSGQLALQPLGGAGSLDRRGCQ